MPGSAADVRAALEAAWNARAARARPFASESLAGYSPPSVFVGSRGYPSLGAGPLLSPGGGDASLLDSPERWAGMPLARVAAFRLGLVRGTRAVRADRPHGRYVESLQEVAMSSRPAGSEVEFEGRPRPARPADGASAPFGPVGVVRSARFGGARADRRIEAAYYDGDLGAAEAAERLHSAGVEVSRIQRCLSAGMLGARRRRRLVPTRWAITAADAAISESLVRRIREAPLADSHTVRSYSHMGNTYSVVLFPRRWAFELVEAWQAGGAPAFASDSEGPGGPPRDPATAGAYHAARLAVAERLAADGAQAAALVLREVRPEYSVPVGVWQVREGVRAAMAAAPRAAEGPRGAVEAAAAPTSVSAAEWAAAGRMARLARQSAVDEFL